MEAVGVDVLVLNYNGRNLLAECLPSVVRAAAQSRNVCRVTVVDNSSSDDSLALLRREFPAVAVLELPNRGLASFNTALRGCTGRVALLLNNDIKLADDAIDPLVAPLVARESGGEPVFLTAPRCTLFDGETYEGFKTAVRLRRGLVQATALFPGCLTAADTAGPTASAGAALAVDRELFLELGGFDPLYLPGRIEDLDFCYRGFLAGYQARYVPESTALHRGAATFGPTFGTAGCDRLALRNTLLFQWKNLRLLRHRLPFWFWAVVRCCFDIVRAPLVAPAERFAFLRAMREAGRIWAANPPIAEFQPRRDAAAPAREREYFRRHAPRQLLAAATGAAASPSAAWADEERRRSVNYPLARWYLRPLAVELARRLAPTAVQPWHLTIVGLACAVAAAVVLVLQGEPSLLAAALVLAAWFFDRTDGPLARLRRSASQFGAWLDANVDEAVDLGLHVCTAAVAAHTLASSAPWAWLIGFLVGKYLLMYGLSIPLVDEPAEASYGNIAGASRSWRRALYHFPANADVRIHLLAAAIAAGLLVEELALIAIYYNLRWLVRYARVALRMRQGLAARGAA